MKSWTARCPGKKLGWRPPSSEAVREAGRGEVSQAAETTTGKMTLREGGMQKTQRPRKEIE